MINKDLEYIKRHYSERFAKLCRELFPTILEHPGLLKEVITENFDNTSTLYEDLVKSKSTFAKYVYTVSGIKPKEVAVDLENMKKSPYELFDKAGYILYPECKTAEDICKFQKYYACKEELCTFLFPEIRLINCRVWFAVKKDIDNIKRENFKIPNKEDEYSRSVISIQFSKSVNSMLSIKNRYNHGNDDLHPIENPDSTFDNNLDNIIPGLTASFYREFDIKNCNSFNEDDMLPSTYRKANDGKYYKEIAGLWGWSYCENNKVIMPSSDVIEYDKFDHLVFDYFVLNLKKKTFDTIDLHDSFPNSIGKIDKISIYFDDDHNKIIKIKPLSNANKEDIILVLDKGNHLISYINNNVKEIGDNFLSHNRTLKYIELKNVKTIGNEFLKYNLDIEKFDMPKLKSMGKNYFVVNKFMKKNMQEFISEQNVLNKK